MTPILRENERLSETSLRSRSFTSGAKQRLPGSTAGNKHKVRISRTAFFHQAQRLVHLLRALFLKEARLPELVLKKARPSAI
jgi:hypothetical protein